MGCGTLTRIRRLLGDNAPCPGQAKRYPSTRYPWTKGLCRRLRQWFPGETFPQMHDLRQAYQLIPNRFEEREERLRVEGSSQAELEHLGERVLDGTRLDDLFQ